MEPTMIEVKRLALSPQNARKTCSGMAMQELKASLLAHGLMQNLVVTAEPDGIYRVIAGGRRLEALRQLQAEGHLPEDHAVSCRIACDARAFELSLAENTVRLAMHPADQFEAFARLAESGEPLERIAQRFGVSLRHVEQRLSLGKLAPELIEAYRAERLTLECLMAFTVTDDQAKQLAVFGSLPPWQVSDARAIRAAITGELAEAGGKLARFVGLDAYHAAGGVSRTDLFGDRLYLEHPKLLSRLAAEKLETVRAELEAEGWGWIELSIDEDHGFRYQCGRIQPRRADGPPEVLEEQERLEDELEELQAALEDTETDEIIDAIERAEARLGQIEETLAAHATFDPDEIRHAGCYVTVAHDGALSVTKGLVRREDVKRLARLEGDDAAPVKPKTMPQTLLRDLEAYRLRAAQVEIARHRLIALDLLIFAAARAAFARPIAGGPEVRFITHQPAVRDGFDHLAEIREALPLGWLEPKAEAEQFHAFLQLSDPQKLDLLAYCVATSLQPQFSTGHEATAYETALALTGADVSAYWRPAAASYLLRINRQQLLDLGRHLFADDWAHSRHRDKKGQLAAELERAFADPARYGRTPQQREKLTHWLPEGMAFGAILAEPPASAAEESPPAEAWSAPQVPHAVTMAG